MDDYLNEIFNTLKQQIDTYYRKKFAGMLPSEKCFFKRDLPLKRYKDAKLREEGYNECLNFFKKIFEVDNGQ